MGAYIYKVTSKKVRCSDGKLANVAVYAYKPSRWDEKFNSKQHFKSGCYRAEDYAAGRNCSDRIVVGEHSEYEAVYANTEKLGTFYDDYDLGTSKLPRLEGVTA